MLVFQTKFVFWERNKITPQTLRRKSVVYNKRNNDKMWQINLISNLYKIIAELLLFNLQPLILAACNCLTFFHRCRLQDEVLYFAYLLPMLAIMLLNLIVFGLVISILRQATGSPTESTGIL